MVAEKMKGLLIEPMAETDIPEVLEIDRASFTMPWSETSFFNETRNSHSVPRVARAGGKIVGYLCANRIIDEGHILTFAVHPEFRRRGIASALFADAMEWFRREGCRFAYLEVRTSNMEARGMYVKFGFRELGIRKNYYVSPVEDAVIMVLKLGG